MKKCGYFKINGVMEVYIGVISKNQQIENI